MTDRVPPPLVDALLDAQREHRAAKIVLDAHVRPLNATVLGFDYYEGALLLDGLSNALHGRLIEGLGQRTLWLQLRYQGSFMRIQCQVESFQFDLLTVKVLNHVLSDNQRWQPRIHFDSRRGPEMRFMVKNSLPFEGHVRNLSPLGAMVEVYGVDLREKFAKQTHFACTLRFNDLFEIPLDTELKQFRFKRKPSCHSSLRVTFTNLNSVAHSQIDTFIHALHTDDFSCYRTLNLNKSVGV